MKLSIEIKDEKFGYDFEVGGERGHGDRPLNAHGLKLFTDIIYECHRSWATKNEEDMQEIRCFAYLEKHPETIKKYIEVERKRGK